MVSQEQTQVLTLDDETAEMAGCLASLMNVSVEDAILQSLRDYAVRLGLDPLSDANKSYAHG